MLKNHLYAYKKEDERNNGEKKPYDEKNKTADDHNNLIQNTDEDKKYAQEKSDNAREDVYRYIFKKKFNINAGARGSGFMDAINRANEGF